MPLISRFNTTAARAFGFSASIGNPPTAIELLVVGGGGSGAYGTGAGGGGGGGYIENLSFSVTRNSSYTVTVGAGGASRISFSQGLNGGNSVFSTETAIGGGGGSYARATMGATYGAQGDNGGSGGGGAISWVTAPAGNYYAIEKDGRNGTVGQGNAGQTLGSIFDYSTDPTYYSGNGGGGGGAGTAASGASASYDYGTGITTVTVGSGGDGLQSSITGTATYYAGGGRGDCYINDPSFVKIAGTDGLGGGSTANRGGGGNGKWGASGAGGSGVVIIAYPDTFDDPIITGATYTKDTVTRSGYKVFKFTAGTGTVLWK